MTRRPLPRCLALLAPAAACLAAGLAAAPGADAAPLRYVALGDSYSAASGVFPLAPGSPPMCLRSSANYPHVLAARIGATLTDVSCGAAETKDFFVAQYSGLDPQLDALSANTQLVTMTIGGNDSGVFINTILQCGSAGVLSLGQGSPCRDQQGSKPEDTIRNVTYPAIVRALQAVRAKAPNAKIGILGYPWIVPASGGCFDKMPIASGDVPYVRGIQATLNDAVGRAAAATGVTYVSTNAVSEGRDACQPIGTRWIEPVLQGTNPVIVHPNALGEAGMAAEALRVLDPLAAPVATAAPRAKLRVSGLRRRDGRYSVTLSATGAAVPGVRISVQRVTSGGRHVVVARKSLKAAIGTRKRRVQLPLTRARAKARYRVVVRGAAGSSAIRGTLSFRAR